MTSIDRQQAGGRHHGYGLDPKWMREEKVDTPLAVMHQEHPSLQISSQPLQFLCGTKPPRRLEAPPDWEES